MQDRVQMVDALRARSEIHPGSTAQLPLLSEGITYQIELCVSKELTSATLRSIVDESTLGRGFSFQLPGRRIFIYERDLLPGPKGILLTMVS